MLHRFSTVSFDSFEPGSCCHSQMHLVKCFSRTQWLSSHLFIIAALGNEMLRNGRGTVHDPGAYDQLSGLVVLFHGDQPSDRFRQHPASTSHVIINTWLAKSKVLPADDGRDENWYADDQLQCSPVADPNGNQTHGAFTQREHCLVEEARHDSVLGAGHFHCC